MTSRKRRLITRPHGTASSRTPSSVATRKKAKPIYTGRPVLSGDMCAVVALLQKRYSKKVHRLAHFSPSPLSFLRFLSVPFSLSGDRVCAIENGFTLLRYSSDGVSTVVSPLGETIAFTLDTAGPQVILWPSIPTTPHVPTLYPYIGFTLEITCLALSFLVWVCALADENWVRATLVNYGIRDAEESESEEEEEESLYSRVEQDAERASLVADSHVPADRRL